MKDELLWKFLADNTDLESGLSASERMIETWVEKNQDEIDKLSIDIDGGLEFESGDIDGIADRFKEVRGEAEATVDATAQFLTKAGRLVGIVGAVGAAAKFVFDGVVSWTKEATGYNAELKKSIELQEELNVLRDRQVSNRISAARRTGNFDEERKELLKDREELAATARNAKERLAKESLNIADFIGAFNKSAGIATQKTIDTISDTAGIENDRLVKLQNEAKETKKNLDQIDAALASLNERELDAQAESGKSVEKLSAFEREKQALEERVILLTQGEVAAGKYRDEVKKIPEAQREELAQIRQRKVAIEELIEKEKERAREAKRLDTDRRRDERAIASLGSRRDRQTRAASARRERLQDLFDRQNAISGAFISGDALSRQIATSAASTGQDNISEQILAEEKKIAEAEQDIRETNAEIALKVGELNTTLSNLNTGMR